MTLFLKEDEVRELLSMEEALERVESSFLAQKQGDAVNRPRQRILLKQCSLHYMAAALPSENLLGMKVYTAGKDGVRFLVLLYEAESGALLAQMEADWLGRLRTGAASGVATKYLARKDASRVGIIGTGGQAKTQLEAVAKVRTVSEAWAYARDVARRRAFCEEMEARLGFRVRPAECAEEAVRFGDILITATTARAPVLLGKWLRPGAHVNAIGANMANRREVDNETLERATVLAVDSREQAEIEAGDLIQGLPSVGKGWNDVVEMKDVVARSHPGRRSDEEITLFKSCGIALWDVAVAGLVYRKAKGIRR